MEPRPPCPTSLKLPCTSLLAMQRLAREPRLRTPIFPNPTGRLPNSRMAHGPLPLVTRLTLPTLTWWKLMPRGTILAIPLLLPTATNSPQRPGRLVPYALIPLSAPLNEAAATAPGSIYNPPLVAVVIPFPVLNNLHAMLTPPIPLERPPTLTVKSKTLPPQALLSAEITWQLPIVTPGRDYRQILCLTLSRC